jgi:hypothetical protein
MRRDSFAFMKKHSRSNIENYYMDLITKFRTKHYSYLSDFRNTLLLKKDV